jgi:hypothetical protein
MNDVRRADAPLRRQVVFYLIVATCAGALLIIGFERYRIPLREWILQEPGAAHRLKFLFLFLAAVLTVPLLAIAAYVWTLGKKIIRAREFPPPGLRVLRDTPVITEEKAVARGRLLQVFAVVCAVASVLLSLLLWRLASLTIG